MKRGDLFRVYRGNNTDTKDFRLPDYIGSLSKLKLEELNEALINAVGVA